MPTEADMREFIFRRLGKGCLQVELTNAQVDDAIDEAKRWWMRYQGNPKRAYLTVVAGQSLYDVVPDAENVVDVVFEELGLDVPTVYDVENYDIYPSYIFFSPTGSYADLIQYIQYRQTARRIFGADLDWEWDRPRNKLLIMPEPTKGFLIYYEYTSRKLCARDLHSWEYDMVRRYALAMSMETLGFIRAKYSEIPSAGGSFSLNGDTLLAQADTARSELNEQIRALQKPIPFFGA